MREDKDFGGYVFALVVLLALFGMGVAQGQIHHVTQQIRAPLGTAAAPSITFNDDSTTGFYKSGSNAIDFTAAGTRRMQFGANLLIMGGILYLTDAAGANAFSLTRASTGVVTLPAVVFSSLGTPANGSFAYCSDCTIANPCADSGTGALAKRLGGAWVCN